MDYFKPALKQMPHVAAQIPASPPSPPPPPKTAAGPAKMISATVPQPVSIASATTVPAQTYERCNVIEIVDYPNMFLGKGFALCQKGAKFYGSNIVAGEVYLQQNAKLYGGSDFVPGALFILGERSEISDIEYAGMTVKIGADCVIEADGKFKNVAIGDNVHLGGGADLTNAFIADRVVAGDQLIMHDGSQILSGAVLGNQIEIGAKSSIASGILIGDEVCIGRDVHVTKNIPSSMYLNDDGILHARTPGKIAKIDHLSGACVEQWVALRIQH